jgi:hypothetical protein
MKDLRETCTAEELSLIARVMTRPYEIKSSGESDRLEEIGLIIKKPNGGLIVNRLVRPDLFLETEAEWNNRNGVCIGYQALTNNTGASLIVPGYTG